MDSISPGKNFSLKRNNQTSLVYAVVLAAAIILVGWFLVLPKLAAVRSAGDEQKQTQDRFQTIEQDKQTFNQLVAKLSSSAKDIGVLDQALPLDARVSKLELLAANLVGSSGMKLVTVSASLPPADAPGKTSTGSDIAAGNKPLLANPYKANRQLRTIPLAVTVSGTTDQFKGLLRLIETSPRILDVESFDLTQDKDGAIIFHLKLKAYSYAP